MLATGNGYYSYLPVLVRHTPINWRLREDVRMHRWRLLTITVPLAVLVLLLTFIRHDVLKLPSLVQFSSLGSVITGAVLIIGFMMAGVLSDHKAAEGLPGQLASALESYADSINAMAAANGELDAPALRADHLQLVRTCEHWLLNGSPVEPCFDAMHTLQRNMEGSAVAKGVPPLFQGALDGMTRIRNAVGHIHGIRVTSFIPTGYALLRGMLAVILAILIFTSFDDAGTGYAVVGILSFVLISLERLIADLDDPFDYPNGAFQPGSNEIDPMPLIGYRKYLESSEQATNRHA